MTNQELGMIVALENKVAAEVNQICVSLSVKREDDPQVFDELKRKLGTDDQDEVIEAIMKVALPPVCEDMGLDVRDMLDSEVIIHPFDDKIYIYQNCDF